MAKPWERYAAAETESPKPWERYAAPPPALEGPSIGPRAPRSLIDEVKDYVAGLASERRIGAEEREQAKAAGIGLTPTTGELALAASAPLLPVAAAAAPVAALAGMLGGHFGAKVGGGIGEAAAETFVPGAGSLGEEIGGTVGGFAGGAAGGMTPAAVSGGARAIGPATARAVAAGRAATARATANPVVRELGNLALDVAPAPVRMAVRYGKKAASVAEALKSARPATPSPISPPAGASSSAVSFADVPDLTRFMVPVPGRAAIASAVAEAGGGELATMMAQNPQLAARVAGEVVPRVAATAETAPLAASASPKVIFDLAFKQAVAAGKSVPEAATIARAARIQAATGTGGQLAQSLGPVVPAAPTGLNAAYTPELAAIAEKQFTPWSRPEFVSKPFASVSDRLAMNPALLEQSALLARMLGQ